jgi:DNA-binding transcriptional regulator YiaG
MLRRVRSPSEADFQELEARLIENPRLGVVERGTGGVRKLRVALSGRGRSGGAKVMPEESESLADDRRTQSAQAADGATGEGMTAKKSRYGAQLIEALTEAVAIERGEAAAGRLTRRALTARQAIVPAAPKASSRQILRLRERFALSQPVFAQALNVSADTVRAWEQGKGVSWSPARASRSENCPSIRSGSIRRRASRIKKRREREYQQTPACRPEYPDRRG